MLKFKISEEHLVTALVDRFLSLIDPINYQVAFVQNANNFSALKANAIHFPPSVEAINIEFKSDFADELIALFYNEKITNMTLASDRYQVDYSYANAFHIYLDSKTKSAKEATDYMVNTLEQLHSNGLHLGFKDESHAREVMEFFFINNFYSLKPHKWHCQLGLQETMIRPGFRYAVIEDHEGKNQSVLAQVDFEILRLSRILGPQKIDTYLKPLFDVLNNGKKYTVYIRELTDLNNMILPSSDLFKLSFKFCACPDPGSIWNFFQGNSMLTVRNIEWSEANPFQWVHLEKSNERISLMEIVFEDEVQRDAFLTKVEYDFNWEEVDFEY